jgi:hypothetical protein
MRYIDAIELLPSASYIYADVTSTELAKIKIAHYTSELEGKTIVGTSEPIDKLSSKLLIPGSITF